MDSKINMAVLIIQDLLLDGALYITKLLSPENLQINPISSKLENS